MSFRKLLEHDRQVTNAFDLMRQIIGEKMSIREEVKEAYADCWLEYKEGQTQRNLDFKASGAVSPKDAKSILEEAKVFYNNFEPNLLDEFPEDCEVTIAREGSVCLYVKGKKLPSQRCVLADEYSEDTDGVRYWWD